MIQLQFLNYILDQKDFSAVRLNNLNIDYFSEYEKEYSFIEKHYDTYAKVPDKETFISYFPEFQFIQVNESIRYLLDSLQEDYVYRKAYKVFESVNKEMMEGDSRKGVELLLSKLPDLTSKLTFNAVDLLHDGADKRFEQYCEMGEDRSKYFIPTGLEQLDNLIGGWDKNNDFVAICGRPGKGKSWWLDYFLLKAAEQGKTVGLYSGEMDEAQVGYRLDTFMSHISNFKMSKGYSDVFDDYKSHIEKIKQLPGKFIVCTPKTLGGTATVPKLRAFCERYKIDLLGIDQYSLLDDVNKNRDRNTRFETISKDIKTMQMELGIPVLINAQLNRATMQDGNADQPGTENIAGSDRLGQDCSIVLSLTNKEDIVTLVVSKTRSSEGHKKLSYKWNIDKGELDYVETDSDNNSAPKRQKVKPQTPVDNALGKEYIVDTGVNIDF